MDVLQVAKMASPFPALLSSRAVRLLELVRLLSVAQDYSKSLKKEKGVMMMPP
jgi:hypothetical protein